MNINWDPHKHDKKVSTKRLSTLTDKIVRQAKLMIHDEYQKWKRPLTRAKKDWSQPEIVQHLYRLHDMVAKAVEQALKDAAKLAQIPVDAAESLQMFRDFSMNMVEDKIAQCIATDLGQKNQIYEFIPQMLQQREDMMSIPECGVFTNPDELAQIPFVAKWAKKEHFVGFVRESRWVKALFDDGELLNVGVCLNGVGLDKVMPLQLFQETMAKEKKGKKE